MIDRGARYKMWLTPEAIDESLKRTKDASDGVDRAALNQHLDFHHIDGMTSQMRNLEKKQRLTKWAEHHGTSQESQRYARKSLADSRLPR